MSEKILEKMIKNRSRQTDSLVQWYMNMHNCTFHDQKQSCESMEMHATESKKLNQEFNELESELKKVLRT